MPKRSKEWIAAEYKDSIRQKEFRQLNKNIHTSDYEKSNDNYEDDVFYDDKKDEVKEIDFNDE